MSRVDKIKNEDFGGFDSNMRKSFLKNTFAGSTSFGSVLPCPYITTTVGLEEVLNNRIL